jgi:hypothetical protein
MLMFTSSVTLFSNVHESKVSLVYLFNTFIEIKMPCQYPITHCVTHDHADKLQQSDYSASFPSYPPEPGSEGS